MAQIKTRNVSFSFIVGAKAFREGVEDYLNGVAPDFDKPRGKHVWTYERGRQYAAACAADGRRPISNRVGPRVNRAAIRDLADLYGNSII